MRRLHLWTVQNRDAAGGDHRSAAAASVGVDMSSLQESNEMAEAAYDSFDTDLKLQEDSAILAEVA